MSNVSSPLQKYGELLGRSIKIIECEVDPESVACIIRHNNYVDHMLNIQDMQEEIVRRQAVEQSISDDESESSSHDGEEYVLHNAKGAETFNQATANERNDTEENASVDVGAESSTSNTVGIVAEETGENLENNIAIEMAEEISEDQEIAEIESATEAFMEEFESVSNKISIEEYSQEEWKGTTYTAECMRSGYTKIISETHCNYLRRIRGDNYCGLRSTIFQCLTQSVEVFEKLSTPLEELITIPNKLIKDHKCDWLLDWTFANRIPSTTETRLDILKDCLSYFAEQIQISRSLADIESRDSHFTAVFNSGTKKEIYLFEAMKVMMLYEAVKLFEKHVSEIEVPMFAWLMFARDTSDSPKSLMLNHFNSVGNSGGLEQVEMCLLGYTLNTTISVFRPSKSDQEDFTSYYPDDHIGIWENCYLVAEDDRHYNIITD